MLGKMSAILNLFRQGSAVANPAAWKKGQITVTMLGGMFIAVAQVAKAFGYDVGFNEDTAAAIAGGVIALVNFLLTLTTTDKIGVLPAKAGNDDGTGNSEQPVPVTEDKNVQLHRYTTDFDANIYRG